MRAAAARLPFGFSCGCRWADEINFGQRQLFFCGRWILVASANEPMINFGQRQPFFCGRWISVASAKDPVKLLLVKGNHFSVGDGFQLPLPSTQWNQFWSKATMWPWNQEFSCLCRWSDEIALGQRQLYDLGIRNSVASGILIACKTGRWDRWNKCPPQGSHNQNFVV